MRDTQLYQRILGLEGPWQVKDVELDVDAGRVDIRVEHEPNVRWVCPACGRALSCYDHAEERTWRHLDTCQYQTHLHARIPRVNCPEHGVKQVDVPWAGKHSRFTLLLERLVIDTLLASQSVSRTATLTGVSWDQAQAVMQRAVERGRGRKAEDANAEPIERIGVDEKAFRKGHRYITVVCDLDGGTVEHVAEDRKVESLGEYYDTLSDDQKQAIRCVAMDMWPAYIRATHDHLPDTDLPGADKIVFDRFHVMKLATEAVDRVRRAEHKTLRQAGESTLTGTKYLWLWSEDNMPEHRAEQFEQLKTLNLKTSRAWAIKETLRDLWEYVYRGPARKFFARWFGWARRSQLKPIRQLAATLRDHLDGILAYCKHRVTNGVTEGINSTIMTIKRLAGGYRNIDNFKTAIYFHCGGLDLHPR
jgi:transposase